MTMFLAPYTAIADIDGSPLDAGFLFFGEYGKDPELFPVEVFWDADFTVPAAQPIRTRNGYPVRNGSPTKVYLKTAQHSIVIKNRNSAFILVDFKNKGWDASFVVDGDKNQHQINNEQKALNRGYESIAEMLAIPNPVDGMRVFVKNLQGGNFEYSSSQSLVNNGITIFNGWMRLLDNYVIAPEMAGAVGNGDKEDPDDDTSAIQTCINFLLTSGGQSQKYRIEGSGCYAVSDSLLVVNFGFGLNLKLRSIVAHPNYPAATNFRTGKPFFQVGKDAIGGSMVGLNIWCDYVNGGGKATWLDVSGLGAGGSHFHAGKLENVVCGVTGVKPNFHAASNKVTGGYWVNGTGFGVHIEKGNFVVEGWIIDVNFIAEFNAGGVLLRDAQYTYIPGQTDFNGRWLSELTLSAPMPNKRDKTFSNNGQTGVVIASYEQPRGVYKALVYEGRDASALGSKFANGAATCDGWTGNVTSKRVSGTDNFFFDVIHDFIDQPFAKCIFIMPYCGGIVGSKLYTTEYSAKRSTEAYGGANNGLSVAHDGTNLIMRDDHNNSQILTASPTYIAPDRHLYMRDYRIYGAETGVTLTQGVTTDVRTFTKKNDGTVPSVCEMYKLTFSSTDLGLHGEWNVFVNGANNIAIKAIYEQNVTASAAGGTFRLVQGAMAGVFGIVNIQRIF